MFDLIGQHLVYVIESHNIFAIAGTFLMIFCIPVLLLIVLIGIWAFLDTIGETHQMKKAKKEEDSDNV